MSSIKSTHDLLDVTELAPEGPAAPPQRSAYCYLFPKLADEADAGRYGGSDEETIARLKAFEETCFRHFADDRAALPALVIGVPAAHTYFGQFMNHDLSAPVGGLRVNVGKTPPAGIIGTADVVGLGKDWRADVATILEHFVNEHAAPLTLASLYGDGPSCGDDEVENLYQPDRRRFVLGTTGHAKPQTFIDMKVPPARVIHARTVSGAPAPDLPRHDRKPRIADRRNDGNLILSQLHLAFMLVHNAAVTALEQQTPPPADVFAEARQLVTLHYHWLILNDFLPSLLSKSVLTQPLQHWQAREIGPHAVPMEFTTAAFRFGHSMVGRAYDFNANFGQDNRISPSASFADLFNFTSAGNMGDPAGPDQPLPDHWVIDWDRMTRPPTPGPAGSGGAEQIDLNFAPKMLDSAGDARVAEHGSIMFRNLLRGYHRRMPFGQCLAKACDLDPLSPDQVRKAMSAATPPGKDAVDIAAEADRLGFLDQTPAWLYFLCEAAILEQGQRLGPAASQIIADTIVGLMRQNPASVLKFKGGTWHPRDSILRDKGDKVIDSLRAFLLFATKDIVQSPTAGP